MTASQRDIALSGRRLARAPKNWIGARFLLPAPGIPPLTSFSRPRSVQGQIPHPGEVAGTDCPAEEAAELVRARWGLVHAPISHTVRLLFVPLSTQKTAERGRG